MNPAPGDQAALVSSGAATVGLATTRGLFIDYRKSLVAFSKEALSKLHQVEKLCRGEFPNFRS